MLPEKGYKRVFVIVFYALLCLFGAYLFFKYLFYPLLPFLTAFLIISATRPAVKYLSSRLGLPQKFTITLFTLILVSLLAVLIYFAASRLLYELVQLTGSFSSDSLSGFLSDLSERITEFLEGLPGGNISKELTESVAEKVRRLDKLAVSAAQKLMPTILEKLMRFLSFFPSAVIFVVLMFVAMFYIGCDYDSSIAFFSAQLSGKAKNTAREIKRQFLYTCSDLFKAYFLITLITFSELLTGFFILKVRYAVLLAVVTAIVDMLPVLGTGTVLVPWGLVCIIIGDSGRGIGLLALYGTITVIRQIIEPKIVGASIGLYPLITLVAMYCGLKIMGFSGLFVFPIITIVVKSLNDKGIIKLYKKPVPSDSKAIENCRKRFSELKKQDKK